MVYHIVQKWLLHYDPTGSLSNNREELFEILPDVQLLTLCPDSSKDLWQHTMEVVEGVPRDLILRWAALYHDVGKTVVWDTARGSIFAGHAEMGARIWARRARLIGFPENDARKVSNLIAMHMRIQQFRNNWGERAVGKLVKAYEGEIQRGIKLALADNMPVGRVTKLKETMCQMMMKP